MGQGLGRFVGFRLPDATARHPLGAPPRGPGCRGVSGEVSGRRSSPKQPVAILVDDLARLDEDEGLGVLERGEAVGTHERVFLQHAIDGLRDFARQLELPRLSDRGRFDGVALVVFGLGRLRLRGRTATEQVFPEGHERVPWLVQARSRAEGTASCGTSSGVSRSVGETFAISIFDRFGIPRLFHYQVQALNDLTVDFVWVYEVH